MTGKDINGPEDLVGREFAIGLRGYDRDEVDSFLARVAEVWRESMAAAPAHNGLSSTAMAALVTSSPATEETAVPVAAADPFAAPLPVDAEVAAPAGTDDAATEGTEDSTGATDAATEGREEDSTGVTEAATDTGATAEATATPEPTATPAPETDPVVASQASTAVGAVPEDAPSRAEAERDRATAYAERVAAELDRASARTELAQAQEEALHVVDVAQRRAEAVLNGAREKARAEAESVLEDARTRLTPLLEQERAVRARLNRLRRELAALDDEADADTAPTLPPAEDIVTATEDDPDTPEATFPVGYGSIKVG